MLCNLPKKFNQIWNYCSVANDASKPVAKINDFKKETNDRPAPYHNPQQARKFKKVQEKKLRKSNKSQFFFCEIAFLAVFPVQKLIFGHF